MLKLSLVLSAWVLLHVLGSGLWAQSNRATITGTITDPTGAVIAEVDVAATNAETGLVTKALSNEVGIYSVLNPPGNL